MSAPHRLEIEYCPRCRWLLRAGWLGQELLSTFDDGSLEVCLRPGGGGVFRVRLDGERLFDRGEAGRFPEPREIKQAVRDRVDPRRGLGHSERPVD